MLKTLLLIFCVIFFWAACSDNDALLRPTTKTIKHDASEKFFDHTGIKKLCEEHLGIRYLLKAEIEFEPLKNKSKTDLSDPHIYDADERKFYAQVGNNYLVNSYVKFIDDELGYGLFANADIKSGNLIGEYAGVINTDKEIKDHSWAWTYPHEIYNPSLKLPDLSLDAKYAGNALRFVNHSDNPNVSMRRIFQDGYVRTLYIANKNIAKDDQILVSYGSIYWEKRKKRDI